MPTSDYDPGANDDSSSELSQFVGGVLHRLPDEFRQEVGVLSRDAFVHLVQGIMEEIRERPKFREYVCQPPPRPVTELLSPSWIKDWLWNAAEYDESMTLKRALSEGLDEHLAEQLTRGEMAELLAWRTSAECGTAEVFNLSLGLPGYEEARRSVDQQLTKLFQGHSETMEEWYLRMVDGSSFAAGVLIYWLPLSLWAVSRADGIRALNLLSRPARVAAANDPKLDQKLRERSGQSQLIGLDPNERKHTTKLGGAIRDKELYAARKPLLKLKRMSLKPDDRAVPEKWQPQIVGGISVSPRW